MPGVVQFLSGQFSHPPIPKVDLKGKTIIVSGANSGLGLDAAKLLLQLNCSTIILACRSIDKGEAAKQDILNSAPPSRKSVPEIITFQLDLSSFESVVAFAERCRDLPRIDSAILNAGVLMTEFSLSEGYETTITVNVISTFLLATLLVPILRQSALKYSTTPNIAIVGSAVHFWANAKALTSPADGKILTTLSDPEQTDMKARYFLSKLPVMLLVQYLSKILTNSADRDVTDKPLVIINNVAPGYCVTNLFRHDDTVAAKAALRLIGRTSEEGARTLVHGGTAEKETHGKYLSECQVKKASPFVRSAEGDKTAQRLWNELTVIYERAKPGCTGLL